MTRREMRRGFAAALGMLFAVSLTARATAQARTGNNVIAGVVASAASGQPLSGADVTLTDTNGFQMPAETTSDENGRFSFSNVPDGKFVLIASHRGYAQAAYEEHDGPSTAIVTGAGQATTGLILTLSQLGSIYGRVGEDSGDPVPQAQLLLYRRARFNGMERMQRAGQSAADAMGNFEFPRLAPGNYYVCATGQPWYRTEPNPGPNMEPPGSPATAQSALDVAYPLSCYPDTPDSADAEAIAVNAGDHVEADLTMHAVPSLHLLFREPRGDPKAGFQMPQLRQEIFGTSEAALIGYQRILLPENSGDQGTVTVEVSGVAPGQYSVQLQQQNSPDGRSVFGNIGVESSNVSIDASSLATMASVSGMLTVSGADHLPADSSIFLMSEQGDPGGFAKIAADGSFHIPAVPPGAYEVRVNLGSTPLQVAQVKANGATLSDSLLTVASTPVQMTVVAVEPVASVAGIVTRGGKPAGGIFIVLVPEKLNGSRSTWQPNQSDSDGSVTFDRVAPGNYTAVAIEQGWTLDWHLPEVISRYLAGGVRVTVAPGVKRVVLSGRVEAQSLSK